MLCPGDVVRGADTADPSSTRVDILRTASPAHADITTSSLATKGTDN